VAWPAHRGTNSASHSLAAWICFIEILIAHIRRYETSGFEATSAAIELDGEPTVLRNFLLAGARTACAPKIFRLMEQVSRIPGDRETRKTGRQATNQRGQQGPSHVRCAGCGRTPSTAADSTPVATEDLTTLLLAGNQGRQASG
jgi:hypothetical protein